MKKFLKISFLVSIIYYLNIQVIDAQTSSPPPKVKHFVLVNAETNEDVQVIHNWSTIDLDRFNTKQLNIRAEMEEGKIGSVSFKLIKVNGFLNKIADYQSQVENIAPYALYGDEPRGDFRGHYFELGQYKLVATPYSGVKQTGSSAESLEVYFKFVGGIQKLVLVDAKTDKDIQELRNGDIIDYNQIGTRSISIRTESEIYPTLVVDFVLYRGEVLVHHQSEFLAPFALFGGTTTDYTGETLSPGEYTLYASTNDIPHNILFGVWTKRLITKFRIEGKEILVNRIMLANASTGDNLDDLSKTSKISFTSRGLAIQNQDGNGFGYYTTQGISILADVGADVKSVKFVLKTDKGHTLIDRVENSSPFVLLGDKSPTNFVPWKPEPGKYVLEVSAYSQAKAQGEVESTFIHAFEVGEYDPVFDSQQEDLIRIYPNPTDQDFIKLNFSNKSNSKGQLKLFDKYGNLIHQQELNLLETDFDVHNLNPGYYIFLIETESGETHREAFIKN